MFNKPRNQVIILSILFLSGFFVYYFPIQGNKFGGETSNMSLIKIDTNYFKGKTIEWIVPFKEGGGGDIWARFNAPFLTEYLPGHPTIIITNIPGGGSIKGANIYVKRAKPDGLMILCSSASTQLPFLLDDPRVQYDYADFASVMAYPNGGVVYVSNDLGIKDASEIRKLKDVPLIFASQGPTSIDMVPTIAFHLLGLNVKTIFGFKGRGDGRLAFERGEVKIDTQTSSAYLKTVVPMVQEGKAIPLWSWGILDETGNLVRDPSFPEIPHFGEIYEIMHGKKGEGVAYNAFFAAMISAFGGMKLLLVPKETPVEIINIYQEAFDKMKLDPDYIAKKEIAIGTYDQEIREKAKVIFKLATTMGAEEKDWCKDFLRNNYGLNL